MRRAADDGLHLNGAYAEYVLADPAYVGRLPATVEFAQVAPILCKGLKMLDCRAGDWVAVSGICAEARREDNLNTILGRMRKGDIEGRMVLRIA